MGVIAHHLHHILSVRSSHRSCPHWSGGDATTAWFSVGSHLGSLFNIPAIRQFLNLAFISLFFLYLRREKFQLPHYNHWRLTVCYLEIEILSAFYEAKQASFLLDQNLGSRNWSLKSPLRDFPYGPVVKNLPSNTGDLGSIPGQGTKIAHAAGQLSPRATTTEPTCSGAQEPQLERSLSAATKSPHAATEDLACRNKTRHSQK